MKRVWITAALLAAAGMTTAARAQDEYVLQYKHPEQGEVAVLHTISHVAGVIQGMGIGTIQMTQETQQWISIECLEINEDGIAKVRMKFERMAMDMDVGANHVSFDTAEPPSTQPGRKSKQDEAQEAMRKTTAAMFAGKGLTGTISPEGKPLKVEGLEEMFEGMKHMPGGEQMAKAIGESMSENVMENAWSSGADLPAKPVRIGEVWSSEKRMKLGPLGQALAKSKNKLLGVETVNGRRIARIGKTTNMEVVPDLAGLKIPGAENMQMKMVSQGGTGTWLWDIDKGRVIKMQESAPLEMTIEFGSTTQPSVSLKMTAKFNYSEVGELVGDEAAASLLPTEESARGLEPPASGAARPAAPTTQPAAAK